MISKKFIRNSFIYTIAGTLPMASAIILLPVYIEYLSTPMYGALTLYTGFSLLIQILVTYSFDTSIYTYYHDFKNDPQQLKVFVSSVFTFILLVGAATSVLFFFLGNWIFGKVFSDSGISFFPYGIISLVSGIFQAIFKVNSSLLQTQEKALSFLWNNLISFSLIAAFTILGLHWFPNDLIGPILGRLIAVGVSGGWVLGGIYYQFGFHFNFSLVKSTFGFNHPSLIYQIQQWFNNYFDRVLMSLYVPLSQVGIYDLAAKCLLGIEFVMTGLYSSFYPRVLGIIALQKEKKSTIEINRYYNGLAAVAVLLVTGAIFALPPIITWMAERFHKPDYIDALPLLPLIAVTYFFRALRLYLVMPYTAVKYTKPFPYFYAVIAAVKIGSLIWLVNLAGVYGVIYSIWIGYFAEVAILYFGIRKKFEIKFNAVKMIVVPALVGLLILVLESTFRNIDANLLHFIYILVGLAILVWAYRAELKPGIFKLK